MPSCLGAGPCVPRVVKVLGLQGTAIFEIRDSEHAMITQPSLVTETGPLFIYQQRTCSGGLSPQLYSYTP